MGCTLPGFMSSFGSSKYFIKGKEGKTPRAIRLITVAHNANCSGSEVDQPTKKQDRIAKPCCQHNKQGILSQWQFSCIAREFNIPIPLHSHAVTVALEVYGALPIR